MGNKYVGCTKDRHWGISEILIRYSLQDIRRQFPSIINSRPEIKEIRNCALNIDFQILFFSLKQIALHLQKKKRFL